MSKTIADLYTDNPVTTLDGTELSELEKSGASGAITEASKKAYYNSDQPKVYVALLTQTSTGAPTATIIKNTLGGTVVFARTGTGSYTATLTAAWVSGKTFIPINQYFLPFTGTDFIEIDILRTNANVIGITTVVGPNGAGVNGDGLIANFAFKVEVYP